MLPRLLILTVVTISMGRSVGAISLTQMRAHADASAIACVALVLPSVQGVEGSAGDVAVGLRDLFAKYLGGPSIRPILLDAPLLSQAMEEARLKACAYVLTVTLTRKRGGGSLKKAFVQTASSAAMFLPGVGVSSSIVHVAAAAGTQAMATMATSTRAKDEIRLEYAVAVVHGAALVPSRSDQTKARADGEDIVTPLVERAATVIAAALGSK